MSAADHSLAEDAGGSVPPVPVTWHELTDTQHYLLIEAFEASRLMDALNGWVNNADAPYWNRKHAYLAPLIAAAQCLTQWGFIELWREPAGPIGEPVKLFDDDALAVLAEPRSWWRYDGTANWDESQPPDLLYRSTDDGSSWPQHTMLATSLARALTKDPPRPTDSRLVRIGHEHRRMPTLGQMFLES